MSNGLVDVLFQCGRVLEGLLSLVCIGCVLIGGRVYLMGNKPPEFAPADNPASDSDSLLTRTLTYHYLPFLNAWLLLYPRVLSFDWSMEAVPLVESLTDPRNVCSAVFYFLLIYALIYILRYINATESYSSPSSAVCTHYVNGNGHMRVSENGYVSSPVPRTNGTTTTTHPRRRRRGSNSSTDSSHSDDSSMSSGILSTELSSVHVLLLSLALLVLPFIPATNLFFYVGFVIAERVLYIPSMGFCLLVAHGAYILYTRCSVHRRSLVPLVLGVLISGYGFRTVLRNIDWHTEENLYRAGINVNPAKGEQ